MAIRVFLLTLFLFASLNLHAQEEEDSTSEMESVDADAYTRTYFAPSDTVHIEKKSFSSETLRELKQDPALDYKELPTVAESLWDRILRWIAEFINSFFEAAYTTDWGRFFLYIGLVALIVVLVMTVLKVNAFRMLYSRTGSPQKLEALDENIHEMDFEKLIQESINRQDFRRAIRLLFLYSLKLLADRHLILWQLGKTNHDYVGELQQTDLRRGLNELSFYFDYAWYGNFQVNRETFDKVQSAFRDFKSKL